MKPERNENRKLPDPIPNATPEGSQKNPFATAQEKMAICEVEIKIMIPETILCRKSSQQTKHQRLHRKFLAGKKAHKKE